MTELQDVMQSAFTYVRERDFRGADLAFQGVAQQARHAGLSILEAEAWRMRARLQIITAPAHLVEVETSQTGKRLGLIPRKRVQRPELEYLQKAEQAITETKAISESDRQDEHALLLRERVEAAAGRGLFAEGNEGLAELEGMATDSPSSVIQAAFNGAKGAVLLYQGKYDDAMPLLARDDHNAFSLYRSAYADQKTGKTAWAAGRLAATMAFNATAEQAFVGPLLELSTSIKDEKLAAKR